MILSITYLGYSCFLVQTYDGVSVITDPYHDNVGYSLPQGICADIVLSSHDHAAHNCFGAIAGHPACIQGPGERELGWVKIKGIASYHDRIQGEKFGKNTIFRWDMRAVRLCHLGDIGHVLNKETIDAIGPIDILFVPVGGDTVLGAVEATKVMQSLQCKYVIPMHYTTPYAKLGAEPLAAFLQDKKSIILPTEQNKLIITRESLDIQEKYIVPLKYLEP